MKDHTNGDLALEILLVLAHLVVCVGMKLVVEAVGARWYVELY
jgi:hypothetical protein